jgi:hypothetical protein
MKNNTVVTAGDKNYFWGILMMIASMRKSGMDEPVIVGAKGFTPWQLQVLAKVPDVTVHQIDDITRSLTCIKPEIMLLAQTDCISWVDSDAFFTGNCSARLAPLTPNEIHVRKRSREENPMAFKNFSYGEDGHTIPQAILEVWKKDVPNALDEPRNQQSCSACYISVHRNARPFLQAWQDQMAKILPDNNTGVVDRSLKYYHQLDESVLNSLLCFSPLAYPVAASYRLDKDPSELFVHFIGVPKPWQGWTPRTMRWFREYTACADYAVAQGWLNKDELPKPLDSARYGICRLLAPYVNLKTKLRNRLRRIFK